MSTLHELKQQAADLELQIQAAKPAAEAEALNQIRATIREFGFSASQVFGGTKITQRRAKRAQMKPIAPKYRDPKSGATWSGRGKEPAWIRGLDRKAFEIHGE